MRRLYREWGEQVTFVDVLVRQGHPGPAVPPYRSDDDKRRDAERYAREEQIPWFVAVDDLAGSVHARYGMLADPVYLIGTDGRVAFYNYWTHVPSLHRALGHLRRLNGAGVVGHTKSVHPLATLAGGWKAIRRGLPQSAVDLETAMPGSASSLWLGHQAQALLAPVAFTSRPWSASQRRSAALTAAGLLLGAAWRLAQRHARSPRRRLRPARRSLAPR